MPKEPLKWKADGTLIAAVPGGSLRIFSHFGCVVLTKTMSQIIMNVDNAMVFGLESPTLIARNKINNMTDVVSRRQRRGPEKLEENTKYKNNKYCTNAI
jgi:hypothetical protein